LFVALDLLNPAERRRDGTRTGGGSKGASLRDAVRRLRQETVAKRRKAVSIIEHRVTGWHLITEIASGMSRADRAASTTVPWISSPEDHLKIKDSATFKFN